ncbi:MAG: hypothetical protein U1E20_02220 [Methylocystis sp.]|uniref:hypothetical protein n=1 Tax=Methylocystis sp. TaxID=1911079 RepID=UPI00394E84B7
MIRDAEIQEIAAKILENRLAAQKFLSCDVKSEDDFDGVPVIRITAHILTPMKSITDKLNATIEIQDRLQERGEDRFVFLDIDTPADSEDDDAVETSN